MPSLNFSPFQFETCGDTLFTLASFSGRKVLTLSDAAGRSDYTLVDSASSSNRKIKLDGLAYDVASGYVLAVNTRSDEISVIGGRGIVQRIDFDKPKSHPDDHIGADIYIDDYCNSVLVNSFSNHLDTTFTETVIDWNSNLLKPEYYTFVDRGSRFDVFDLVRDSNGRTLVLGTEAKTFRTVVGEVEVDREKKTYTLKKITRLVNSEYSFIELGKHRSSSIAVIERDGADLFIVTKPTGVTFEFDMSTFDEARKSMRVKVYEEFSDYRYSAQDGSSCKQFELDKYNMQCAGGSTTVPHTTVSGTTIDPTGHGTASGRTTTGMTTAPPTRVPPTTVNGTTVHHSTDPRTPIYTEILPTEVTRTGDSTYTSDDCHDCIFRVNARRVAVKIPSCVPDVDSCESCKKCKKRCMRKCLKECDERGGKECEDECRAGCTCDEVCEHCKKDMFDGCNCSRRKNEPTKKCKYKSN